MLSTHACPHRGPVTDILLWIECYSTLVAVLSSHFPTKVPQLMPYQKTIIVKAHRTYAGQGWVTYDIAYRRRAAMKSLDWGVIDFNLYNETFAGRAKAIHRCKFCSSELHTSTECKHTYTPNQSSTQISQRFYPRGPEEHMPVCFKFNSEGQNKCKLKWRRYAHACSDCGGNHPKSSCSRRISLGQRKPLSECILQSLTYSFLTSTQYKQQQHQTQVFIKSFIQHTYKLTLELTYV